MAFLILLFLYHLLLLPSLATSKCQESFQCGNHFPLEFPLSEDPRCGLLRVDGCSGPEFPVVRFDNIRSSYHLIEKISTNKFEVVDIFLSDSLRQPQCFPFMNVSLPKNPSVSFTIPSNLTLFTCYNRTSNELIQDHFSNYSKFVNKDCDIPSPTVYYLYPTTDHVLAAQKSNIPTECGVIQLPIDPNKGKSSKLLDLLTAEFTLEWNVSEECYECFHGGGQCLQNNRNEFHCGKGTTVVFFRYSFLKRETCSRYSIDGLWTNKPLLVFLAELMMLYIHMVLLEIHGTNPVFVLTEVVGNVQLHELSMHYVSDYFLGRTDYILC